MDSVCNRPIDYVLEQYNGEDFISIPRRRAGGVINCHFAATKESPTLAKIIDTVINTPVTDRYWHVWKAYNEIVTPEISSYLDIADHSHEWKEGFKNFPIDYYGEKMTYHGYLKKFLNFQ